MDNRSRREHVFFTIFAYEWVAGVGSDLFKVVSTLMLRCILLLINKCALLLIENTAYVQFMYEKCWTAYGHRTREARMIVSYVIHHSTSPLNQPGWWKSQFHTLKRSNNELVRGMTQWANLVLSWTVPCIAFRQRSCLHFLWFRWPLRIYRNVKSI